jgi:hypothetical protein
VQVGMEDVPTFLTNFEIAAAGKFGHAGIKARSEGGIDLLCRLGLGRRACRHRLARRGGSRPWRRR